MAACESFLRRCSETALVERLPNCVVAFDNALLRFFLGSDPDGIEEATRQFAALLRAEAGLKSRVDPVGARLFKSVAADLLKVGRYDWDYAAHLDAIHDYAVAVAQRFFAPSSSPVILSRLSGSKARLEHEYAGTTKRRLATMEYRSHDHAVVVRFTFEHAYEDYKAYLYWFLHEYTAHVYAADYKKNKKFNDGWMIFAAARFLRRYWRLKQEVTFPLAYVSAFDDHIKTEIERDHVARFGFRVAREFSDWLDLPGPDAPALQNWFDMITLEMAAYEPASPVALRDLPDNWLNELINQLGFVLDHPDPSVRGALAKQIHSAMTAQDLFRHLSRSAAATPVVKYP